MCALPIVEIAAFTILICLILAIAIRTIKNNRKELADASRGWRIKRKYYKDETIAYIFEEYRNKKVWWNVCTVAGESKGDPFSYTDIKFWPKIVIDHADEIEADIGEPLPRTHNQPLE